MLPSLMAWWFSLIWGGCTTPESTLPKYEFRGVWIATTFNIDWPSRSDLNSEEQRAEFIALLDRQQELGINAVIVQVRGSGDALYPSRLAPWSAYLTGTQGHAPAPFYDPLAFMVQACHDRNMEFHAWLNPFRAISHMRFSSVADQHAARLHPEWTFAYGKGSYFDPGIPAVQDHLTDVVMEVVRSYDIDGLHFDDYFYPYRLRGEDIPDQKTFEQDQHHRMDRDAWRRQNIDRFVQRISDSISRIKPWVKFGISPMGIWRNQEDDPIGSDTQVGQTAYDDLHADVRKWLAEGWIDYVAPQLYWSTQHPHANFSKLLDWWSQNAFDRHLYVGHASFKLKSNSHTYWRNPDELPQQLGLTLEHQQVCGSIFYSANVLRDNPHEIGEWLQEKRFHHPALVPPMPWKDSIPPLAPRSLMVHTRTKQVSLTWTAPLAASDQQVPAYYVVYRFRIDQAPDLSNPANIMGVTRETSWQGPLPAEEGHYLFLVTAFDRLHNESQTGAATMWDWDSSRLAIRRLPPFEDIVSPKQP